MTQPEPDPSNTDVDELIEPLDDDDDIHDRLDNPDKDDATD